MSYTAATAGVQPSTSNIEQPMPAAPPKNSPNSVTGVIASIDPKAAVIGIALLAGATIIYCYQGATLLSVAGLAAFYIYRSRGKPSPSGSAGCEKKNSPQATTPSIEDKIRIKGQQDANTANIEKKCGEGSVKRSWQKTVLVKDDCIGFPAGEDFIEAFKQAFLNFESFPPDVNTTLEDYLHIPEADVTKVLIGEVLAPLYQNCETYISTLIQAKKNEFGDTGSDNSIFWRERRQAEMLSVVKALSDAQIDMLMEGGLIQKVHQKMLEAAKEGKIADGANDLRIPTVIRSLLSMMMIAEMSCPRCYVFPKPGTKMKYREGITYEILRPGTKKYGRIQENTEVEVVFPSLYFNDPMEFPNEKPVSNLFVRRLKLDQK